MKTLVISVVLGLVALGMAGYIVVLTEGTLFTVDALFTSLILLTMAGVFFLNAALELRARRADEAEAAGGMLPAARGASAATGQAVTETGTVADVRFYESTFPNPNKTVLTFAADGSKQARLVVFQGNVREQLPVGARVRITYRAEPEGNVLLDRQYSFGLRP